MEGESAQKILEHSKLRNRIIAMLGPATVFALAVKNIVSTAVFSGVEAQTNTQTKKNMGLVGKIILGLLLSQSFAFALITTPVESFDNATVQPGGPRSGTSGKAFLNIEGSDNGSFASFGVMDFSIAAITVPPGEMLSSVNSITIDLVQNNAGFTTDGGLAFYLTTDVATDIQPGTSPLFFDSFSSPGGLGVQLAPTYFLDDGMFTEISTGTIDSFVLSLSGVDPVALSYLSNLLISGGTLRLVAVATDASTAATYSGYTNTTYAGPTVSIDYSVVPVPEPATLTFLGLAGVVLYVRRRKRA